MLKSIHLKNYRCFKEHELFFEPTTTIIVGKNNAGKSTLIEALRLVSLIVDKYQALTYYDPPDWLSNIPKIFKGVRPSLYYLEFNSKTVLYRYGEDTEEDFAVVTAKFDGGEKIKIYINTENKIHGVILDKNEKVISSKGQALNLKLPQIGILPPIGPLSIKEKLLTADYIRSAVSSHLASIHFRNELYSFKNSFAKFKKLSELTWRGLQIKNIECNGKIPDADLSLMVRDEDFVAEVGWMGHGLQMWLQTMWFIARSKQNQTIVLDEPDVYMHPDLQKRLVRFLLTEDKQTIISTHSIEIMEEVKPENIVIIERRKKKSKFATSLPSIQFIVDAIGGIYNLQLQRLWNSRRLIFVEGKDIKLLKIFQDKLFPKSENPIDAIPNMSIGGWGGWNYVVGSSMFLKNSVGESILIYCVLDRDFHTPENIQNRKKEAKEKKIILTIWDRKEIENYLINPKAIQRVIKNRIKNDVKEPSVEEIEKKIDSIIDELHDDTFDNLASEFLSNDRAGGAKPANASARKIMEEAWKKQENKLSIVSGKKVISKISELCQDEYGVSLSATKIAYELNASEIPREINNFLASVEKFEPL